MTAAPHRSLRSFLAALVAVVSLVATATLVTAATVPTGVRPAGADTPSTVPTYRLVARDGGVFTFGGAGFYGSMGGVHLNAPVVGMAATPDGKGYWLDASDGGIFTFGDAPFLGSMGAVHLNAPVVGMAATSDGKGYWLVASDGGIFTFGDAPFLGSMGGVHLKAPVVGMAATPDGKGYWLVASDGGIFTFGDATYYGSMGNVALAAPVVGMSTTADGLGYWMVASDGGIFTFGDAPYLGTVAGMAHPAPIAAMGASPTGTGYWEVDTQGLVYNFGTAGYYGSTPNGIAQPIVGLAISKGSGQPLADPAYQHGAVGYDISKYQCSDLPAAPFQIGVVEVNGASGTAINPCLAKEAAWAGGGLNLYTFATYDPQAAGPTADPNYNGGYNDGRWAFAVAALGQIDTDVTWWLDIEGASQYWSGSTAANADYIQGMIDGLRSAGVHNVGIYTSPLSWNGIAGPYQPPVPVWLAWYTNAPLTNCTQGLSYAAQNGDLLPTGGIWMTQYTDAPFDKDEAC